MCFQKNLSQLYTLYVREYLCFNRQQIESIWKTNLRFIRSKWLSVV